MRTLDSYIEYLALVYGFGIQVHERSVEPKSADFFVNCASKASFLHLNQNVDVSSKDEVGEVCLQQRTAHLHASAYVSTLSIRQHTSAYVSGRRPACHPLSV